MCVCVFVSQAHLSRAALPVSDYITDTKTVMDNAVRVCQSMVDVSADKGWLATCVSTVHLVQCVMQVRTACILCV